MGGQEGVTICVACRKFFTPVSVCSSFKAPMEPLGDFSYSGVFSGSKKLKLRLWGEV